MLLVTLWPSNLKSWYLYLRNTSKKVSINLLNSFIKYFRKDIEKEHLRTLILLILSDNIVFWKFFTRVQIKYPKYFLLLNSIITMLFKTRSGFLHPDFKSVWLWIYGTSLHDFFISNTFISNGNVILAKNEAKVKQDPGAELSLFENYLLFSSPSSSKNDKRYSKNGTKDNCICFNDVIWLMTMKMRLKIKIDHKDMI